MVELRSKWKPSRKLNVIADALDFGAADPLPDGVSRDRIEESCYAIRTMYGDYIDTLTEDAAFSRREAQTWVLRNFVHDGSERLSYEAIGLYVWAIGRGTEGDPLSRTIVSRYLERAERKRGWAEETVKRTGPPPHPDERLEEPTVLWIEGEIGERLRSRCEPGETYNEAIERLLGATSDDVRFPELLRSCRETAGIDYCGVKLLDEHWDDRLVFTVHAPAATTHPGSVDADAVVVDGAPYAFTVEETDDPALLGPAITVFDDRDGAASVGIPDGHERLSEALERTEQTLPELVDRLEADGDVGVAVGNDPTAAGAHLFPIREDPASETGVQRHLKRLSLDDRTLTVGAVTPITAAEYDERAGEMTLLWASEGATMGPETLPDDPADRRESVPTPVLKTA